MNILFYKGQRVVFIGNPKGLEPGEPHGLIDGKSYYVNNPCGQERYGFVWITLQGFADDDGFEQRGFIPYDDDLKLENEIHEALKGQKIIV